MVQFVGGEPFVHSDFAVFLDAYDNSIPFDEKRQILSTLNERSVLAGRYCKGHGTKNEKRYLAAEQIK